MSGSIPAIFLGHLVAMLTLVPITATSLAAQEEPKVPRAVKLDIDRDGKPDLAVIVETPDDGSGDLLVYLGAGDVEPSPDRRPDFVKKDLLAGTILAFESRGENSLALTTCVGCGARKSTDEILTIVYRKRTFMVGGFDRSWDLNTDLASGEFETKMGSCSVNFLTGEGRISDGLEPDRPVKQRFKPVALADWSEETIPGICELP
jgi:hypothetical protein